MKKFLLIAVCTLASLSGFSQGGSMVAYNPPLYRTSLDTVDNAETKTYTCPVTSTRQSATFQLDMIDISGDPSGVIATWSVSADGGQNYITVQSDTMANANTVKKLEIEGSPYTHVKCLITGAGTHSSSYRLYMLLR